MIYHKTMYIKKIISGGQTGVDRAALDAAIKLKIPHGGYCPKGRLAEDGIIPTKYNLIEHDSTEYANRTFENVLSSDGTLLLHSSTISNGTELTKEYCIEVIKPFVTINILWESELIGSIIQHWLQGNSINILNVAGPRESEGAIYSVSKQVLLHLLRNN